MDAIGDIWEGRPALPQGTVFEHLPPFACRSRAENMAAVRAAMLERKADWHWLSSLDDIAWLLNLRGNDVSYNPVFLAHALRSEEHTSELQSLMRISYAVFCLKKKTIRQNITMSA